MKKITLVLLLAISLSCFGQKDSSRIAYSKITPEKLIYVENTLYQYNKIGGKDSIVKASLWDEFNENTEDRIPIPEKILIKTFFHINSEWANEKIPLGKVFYKTTIQLIYGNIVIGENICNPTTGVEISLLSGSFTGKDFENMFLNNSDFSGLRFQSSTFFLRDYLTKNKIRLFRSENQPNVLGRVVIRTYFGSNINNLNIKYECVFNVIKNTFEE